MFPYCAIHILRYSDCSRGLKAALTFILLPFKPPCCIPPQAAETLLFLGGALERGRCLKLAAAKPVKLASQWLYGVCWWERKVVIAEKAKYLGTMTIQKGKGISLFIFRNLHANVRTCSKWKGQEMKKSKSPCWLLDPFDWGRKGGVGIR